jgi:glycosyltransferase involved in cell wall biosynthesis
MLVSAMNSGGAERVAANLVNAWSARGDRVTLLVTFSGKGECFYQLADNVRLVYLADLAGHMGKGIRAYWARYFALRKFLKQTRPDVVVAFLTNVNVATLLAAIGLSLKVIVAEHIYPPMLPVGGVLNTLRRLTYPVAFRVTMLTQEGLTWLTTLIPKASGVVIPNPVTYPLPLGTPALSPATIIDSERSLLLAIGRMDMQKGFDYLLESFAAIASQYSHWDLVILGEGPEHNRLIQQVADLKMQHRVLLPGRAGNMAEWYARADLYVMSSRFEGFPNTLVEAMAHGCAAVSYDCDTGPRDIIRDGVDGLLITPVGDVPALTQALDRLMGNDAERNQMAQRATEVRERYSMPRILAQWDALFDSVEKGRPTR